MKIKNLIIGDGALAHILCEKLYGGPNTVLVAPPVVSPPRFVEECQTMLAQGVLHSGLRYYLQDEPQTAHAVVRAADDWQLHGYIAAPTVRHMQILSPILGLEEVALRAPAWWMINAPTANYLRDGVTVLETNESVIDSPHWLLGMRHKHTPFTVHDRICDRTSQNQQTVVIGDTEVTPQRIFLAAGAGNQKLLQCLVPDDPVVKQAMQQERPGYAIFLCGTPKNPLPPVDAFVLDTRGKLMVIITHKQDGLGRVVWQLGGLATEIDADDQPGDAKMRTLLHLQQCFLLDFDQCSWAYRRYVRAEGANDGQRPLGPVVQSFDNIVVGWPTKLVWAPRCADMMIKKVGL